MTLALALAAALNWPAGNVGRMPAPAHYTYRQASAKWAPKRSRPTRYGGASSKKPNGNGRRTGIAAARRAAKKRQAMRARAQK